MSWADDDGQDDADSLVYDDVESWVRDWLAPHYRRSLDTGPLVWCEQWPSIPRRWRA